MLRFRSLLSWFRSLLSWFRSLFRMNQPVCFVGPQIPIPFDCCAQQKHEFWIHTADDLSLPNLQRKHVVPHLKGRLDWVCAIMREDHQTLKYRAVAIPLSEYERLFGKSSAQTVTC